MAVKERVGVVVSDKMNKTVVVAVENRSPNPKYGKTVVKTKRYKAHDEENRCQSGDRVRIRETRPLSRTKRWIVTEILEGSHPGILIANGTREQVPPQARESQPEVATETPAPPTQKSAESEAPTAIAPEPEAAATPSEESTENETEPTPTNETTSEGGEP